MGQTQSTHQRNRHPSLSDAQLEFSPGQKTSVVDTSVSPQILKQESENNQGRHVSDDGGEGFIPGDDAGNKTNVPVVFRWEYGGKEVYLSGDFNGWKSRIPMTYGGGEFTTIIELPLGTHRFKFFVDGNWVHDPSQKTIDDSFGGRNNVITVKESDLSFTEALLRDEISGGETGPSHSSSSSSINRLSPPGSYAQLVPSPNKPLVVNDSVNTVVPPSLPPHLLNVILNKDSVDQEDPTLLPVPDHVALNHLYALSIKDNVMTLSATHRYKRKYVTTIMYKPIKASN